MALAKGLSTKELSAKNSATRSAKSAVKDKGALESIAKQTGGTIQGDRVQYQVKGNGTKSTRYAYAGDTPDLTPTLKGGGREPQGLEQPVDAEFSEKGVDTPLSPEMTPAQTGMVSYEQAVKNLSSGGLTGGALEQAQNTLAGAYGKSKYQAAHEALQSAGAPAPGDGGAAMSQVYDATPYEANTQAVDTMMSEDPMMNGIFSQITELLNPKVQATSLMQDYKKLYKDSGLKEINEELIDAETVINGTEDDLRNEIQTAGGFGTESQVQALALARNKGLLARYNALAQMKTDATNQLNTMMSLTQQDKQLAQQKIDSQINTMFKFADFRQTAINSYKETARFNLQTLGADGMYNAMKGDPTQLSRYEKMMGLPTGGLATAAAQAATARANQDEMTRLQLSNQRLQNQKLSSELAPAETGAGQSPAEQVQFLRDTVTKSLELSGGAGASPALNWLSRSAFGATEKDRLATQVRTLSSNMLTLATDPNIKKFFGPQMSDADVKQMLAAGTTLNVDEMNKADLEAELGRLDKIFVKLQGASNGMTVYDPSGGSWLKEN